MDILVYKIIVNDDGNVTAPAYLMDDAVYTNVWLYTGEVTPS